MSHQDYDFDDEPKEIIRQWDEFDCPECDANNPLDEPFGHGDEIRCFYCGASFDVKVSYLGKLVLELQ